MPLYRPKRNPFYYKLKSWRIKKRFLMKMRNQKESQLQRLALGIEPNPQEKKVRSKPLR